jgi:hypothetical protein
VRARLEASAIAAFRDPSYLIKASAIISIVSAESSIALSPLSVPPARLDSCCPLLGSVNVNRAHIRMKRGGKRTEGKPRGKEIAPEGYRQAGAIKPADWF